MSFLDTGLVPNGKTKLFARPSSVSANSWVSDDDWNQLCQTSLDLRAAIIGGKKLGLVPQGARPTPETGGASAMFWLDAGGAFHCWNGSVDTNLDKINKHLFSVLDYGAKFDGVTNDRPAIQAALDACAAAGGGTVLCPVGTGIVGVAGGVGNQPLFIDDNTCLKGMGRGATVIKLCDEANQVNPIALGGAITANVISNKNNGYWTYPVPTAKDSNLQIRDLTVDSNITKQTKLIATGAFGLLSTLGRVQFLSTAVGTNTAGGTLTAGATYRIGVSFLDSNGHEQGVGDSGAAYCYNVTLGGGDNAIALTFPTIPTGATQAVVYLRLSTDGTDADGNELFERQTPFAAPTAGTVVNVKTHGSSTMIPVGFGLIGGVEATASYGIFLDQADNVIVDNVEVRNSVLDGVTLSNPYGLGTTNCTFSNMYITRSGRDALSITGTADNILFDRVICEDNEIGCDVEPAFAGLNISNITFHKCKFKGSYKPGGAGMDFSSFPGYPFKKIQIIDCDFQENLQHVRFAGACFVGVYKNRFDRSYNTGFNVTNAVGSRGVIDSNQFTQCIGGSFTSGVNLMPGTQDSYLLHMDANSSNWVITNNNFEPSSTNNAYQVVFAAGSKQHYFDGNFFNDNGVTNKFFFAALGALSDHIIGTWTTSSGGGAIQDGVAIVKSDATGSPQVVVRNDTQGKALAVGATVTSKAIAFAGGVVGSAAYRVRATLYFNHGGWWVSARSTSGFTISWVTSSPGDGSGTLDWECIF